jgi:general nucleoside transport system permease protein
LLAGLEPLGVIPAALFLSAVLSGIGAAHRALELPLAAGGAFAALLLVTALIARLGLRYRLRFNRPNEAA